VPIPEGEIGEAGAGGTPGIDRIRSFPFVPEIRHRAVGEANPQGARRRRRRIHPGRHVIRLRLARQRSRQEERIRLKLESGWREVQVDVGRQARLRQAIPHAFGPVRIVIARQQMPMDRREHLHALDGREQRHRAGSLVVVNIASDQHVPDVMRDRRLPEALDRRKSRLTKGLLIGAELLEDFPDLPVRRMKKSNLASPAALSLARVSRLDIVVI
jgi:hypothetical protein